MLAVFSRKEFDDAFLRDTVAGATFLGNETVGIIVFTWFPSCTPLACSPGKGNNLWFPACGMGFIAAVLSLFLGGSTLDLLSSKPLWIFWLNIFWGLGMKPWIDMDRFLVGGGHFSQAGGFWGLFFLLSLSPWFAVKDRSRCASSFSNDATDDPWMLATPSETKLR